jgi:glycosyltransferase involved in cell wall biosynthesis
MQNKKNLAILGTRGIPARYGGFETFAEELSAHLVKRGIDIAVFCDTRDTGFKNEYKGIKLIHVKEIHLGPFSTIIHDLVCILRALKGYDLIYMLGYGAGLFFWIPKVVRKTLWVNMDGLEWKRSKWPWYGKLYLKISEWLAAKSASSLIADCERIRDYLTSKYGQNIKCYTIPYGADIVDVPPDVKQLKELLLESFDYYLVVCRLEPENHIREIIQGFVASNTAKQLIIIGNHRMESSYVKALLKTEDRRVRFVGTVYDRAFLIAIRCYAFAYFHGHSVGGTNPSLLEAMGCGNRIIAHDNTFNHEVAADCAIYFSSATDITRIIAYIEKGTSIDTGKKAKDRIRKIYNWDLITDQYQQLIENAAISEYR